MTPFTITLRTKNDDDIRILHAALKVLLRRFGLRAIRVEEQLTKAKRKPPGR
jgi:hypothetical protein